MFELIPIIIPIISTIIAIIIGLRTLRRKPYITFSLFEKAEISIYNQENEENIALLTAPIANEKKRYFGNTAKKITAMVLYRAPADDNWLGLNAAIDLPYIKSNYRTRTRITGQLKTEKDIQKALEDHFFDRTERDIPQGRGFHLAVAYGIEKVNKVFLASKPPIEIRLPPHRKGKTDFAVCFLRLEIAGENIASTVSEGTIIMANSWNNLTVPKKVTTIRTPSRIRNLLLRIGFGREQKVLGGKNH